VVEGTGLENRQGRKPFVGSNPTLSAKFINTVAHETQAKNPRHP
jgi:hypothetical protein